MINKLFEQKLLKLVFENSLTKKKLLIASELYLNSSIKLLSKENNTIQYEIDNQIINLVYKDNRVICYKNNVISSIDEYAIACLLHYKRKHYIKNEIGFKMEDIQLHSFYYNSFFISNIYYEEYQYRFNFYYGLIDQLYKLDLRDYCVKVMMDFFGVLDAKFTYDSKYLEIDKQNLFRVIKDKFDILYENVNDIISSFNMDQFPITTLGKFIYISVINRPLLLQHQEIKKLYEYVFDNYLKSLKGTQLYKDLNKQYSITKWYTKEYDNFYMKNNIDQYEVMYCYVSYLYDKEEYNEIARLFKDYKYYIINNEIVNKIIYSFYKLSMYEEAINNIKIIKNMSLDMYIKYKEDLPLLFSDDNINNILEYIIDSVDADEALKIIEFENKEDYKILILAKKDFNIINDKFFEYLGTYDDQLIKIYQKEITNNLMKIRGYHNHIPEFIYEKLEKLNKIKNGKYYIYELVNEVIKNTYLSFEDDLIDYCKSLEA